MKAEFLAMADIRKWPESLRKQYVDMYGEEYFQWAWNTHLNARIEYEIFFLI